MAVYKRKNVWYIDYYINVNDGDYFYFIIMQKIGDDHYIVSDNRKGQKFDGIFKVTGIMFSPDSKNLAYVALKRKKMVLILNNACSMKV